MTIAITAAGASRAKRLAAEAAVNQIGTHLPWGALADKLAHRARDIWLPPGSRRLAFSVLASAPSGGAATARKVLRSVWTKGRHACRPFRTYHELELRQPAHRRRALVVCPLCC